MVGRSSGAEAERVAGMETATGGSTMGRREAAGSRRSLIDRIPSTTPGAEPPRDARDSGSARSHSTHLETGSSNRP